MTYGIATNYFRVRAYKDYNGTIWHSLATRVYSVATGFSGQWIQHDFQVINSSDGYLIERTSGLDGVAIAWRTCQTDQLVEDNTGWTAGAPILNLSTGYSALKTTDGGVVYGLFAPELPIDINSINFTCGAQAEGTPLSASYSLPITVNGVRYKLLLRSE